MIRSVNPTDLPSIHRLIEENRHIFLSCGREDLPGLITPATGIPLTAVGLWPDDAKGIWGFVAFDGELSTGLAGPLQEGSLQEGALRAVVIGHNMPAGASADQLVGHILDSRQADGQPFQLTALPHESWLAQLLERQQFQVVDHLCLYQRSQRSVPPSGVPPAADSALLRPLRADELAELKKVDSAVFPPLWRMAESELLEMIFTCRIQAAAVDGLLVGYSAASLHPAQDRYDDSHAQLSRLAVHPDFRGRGIGRQLLIDAIAYAHAQGCYRVLLNTPESNLAARQLYESVHFRRHGGRVPVLMYKNT